MDAEDYKTIYDMRLIKLFTTSLFLIASTMVSLACPADPSQTKAITLDDGVRKMVRLMGDEYGNYWKALDNSGCFKRRKGLPYSYVVVNEAEEIQKAELQRRKSIENANQTVGQARALSPKKAQNSTHTALGFPCTRQDLRGNKRMLVILVSFMDKAFSSVNAGMYHDIFNATNYQNGRFSGSVKDYFLAQSNGLMNLQFDIVGPVTVSRNSAYYGEQTDEQTDAHAPEMVREAVDLVDGIVDFSHYDWDDDGIVEHIVVIYAGLGQAEGGIEDDIWAHKGTISSFCDHTVIRNYACASESRLVNGSVNLNGIGTICHEISHCFGLPDTYDQTTGNYGTDRWDLMGTGVHNDNGYTPAGYTAYDKMFCLWQSPVILKNTQNVDQILPLSEGGDFYLIPNDGWGDEFFLLENRQQTGWDSKLPGHGMLITHVDFDEKLFDSNIVNRTGKIGNSTNDHERMGLVLADNDMTVDVSDYYRWLRCLQGDLYPSGNNDCLTNTSTPSAKLFHKNIDDTYLLSKPVTNIKENGDMTMSFTFTNDIAAQRICHLSDINGKIMVMSDTEAKLLVNIKNNGNVDYSRTIGAFVYTKEDGNYKIQASRDTHLVSLAAGETKGCEFYFNELEDDTDYYVFLFYVKEENTTGWTQMGTAYPFNLADRNRFNITMDEEGMLVRRNGNSVDITATFHNDNYRAYNRYIGLYTYFRLENGYTIQQPRAFVIGNIEPFGEKRLTFKLDNMDPDMFYSAFFYYYPYETNSWEQMSGPHLINSQPRLLLGDVNDDGEVNISDVIMAVNYILGIQCEPFNFRNADLNNDGVMTISDVTLIVDVILKKE